MRYFIIPLLFCLPLACNDISTAQSNRAEVPHTPPVAEAAPPLAEDLPSVDTVEIAEPVEPPQSEFSIEYLMGKFDPAKHPDFVVVDKKYADGEGYYLRNDTYDSFQKMWEAAQADGITLTIVSATRNFYRQKQIWEAKWTGQRKIENGTNAAQKYKDAKTRALKILEYSSMPGTSRHHWGTDIDLNSVEPEYFETAQGQKVYAWLEKNAATYGYFQPYIVHGDARETGYKEEKWHWSYFSIADQLLRAYKRMVGYELINGFPGSEYAPQLNVIEHFVQGIPDGPAIYTTRETR